MTNRKWTKKEKPIAYPERFPWITLGAVFVITAASVFFSIFIYLIYSTSHEKISYKYESQLTKNEKLVADLEKLDHELDFATEKNKALDQMLANSEMKKEFIFEVLLLNSYGLIHELDNEFFEDLDFQVDSDGDYVVDVFDFFPDDPQEWFDTDDDGIGDNQDPCPEDPKC